MRWKSPLVRNSKIAICFLEDNFRLQTLVKNSLDESQWLSRAPHFSVPRLFICAVYSFTTIEVTCPRKNRRRQPQKPSGVCLEIDRQWFMVHGAWLRTHGSWLKAHGVWPTQARGARVTILLWVPGAFVQALRWGPGQGPARLSWP